MRPALLLAACLALAVVALGAEAQPCVSDCGCPRGQTCQSTPDGGRCEAAVCTTDVQPVCGLDGKTYSNACRAGLERVGVAHPGPCDDGATVGDSTDGHCAGAAGCMTCHPTVVSETGTVLWTGDPELDRATKVGTGRFRVFWRVDVRDDAFFVQPIAPHDDFPKSLLGWPARITPQEIQVVTDAHFVDSGSHDHRDPLDVRFSLLRCPRVEQAPDPG
jgi:hypothetical protein